MSKKTEHQPEPVVEEPTFNFPALDEAIRKKPTPTRQTILTLDKVEPATERLALPSPLMAMYCLWQDDDWIEASLSSVYPYVGKILCLFNEHPWAGVGVYESATEEIVRAFPDPEDKIAIQSGAWNDSEWGGQLLQRSEGFAFCETHDMPWLFLVDGDEVYSPETLLKIIQWTGQTEADTGRVPCLSFWQDCFHVGWEDTMSRLFRVKPGAHFTRPNTVAYE